MIATRFRRLRDLFIKYKLDALLISNFYNILYMTGFKTLAPEEKEAFVLVTFKNVYLASDGRYLKSSQKLEGILPRIITPEKRLLHLLGEIIKSEKIKTLGFEAEDLRFHEYKIFKQKLAVKLFPTEKIIQKLRAIKDQEEITKIKKACAVADKCLREITKTIKVGQSGREIAFRIEFWLKEKGHDISFQPIVAVDESAAIPHYNTQSGSDKVKSGSLLLIDYGAKVDDYCSDTTRVFFIGKPVDPLANVYNKLIDVQEKTIRQVNKTKKLKNIDLFCRGELDRNGLLNFSHSTGHGVGLEVHENPSVSFLSKDRLHSNQVFTIEPGVYILGKYGMRIEDMVWVKNHSVEVLTSFPKKLSSLIL